MQECSISIGLQKNCKTEGLVKPATFLLKSILFFPQGFMVYMIILQLGTKSIVAPSKSYTTSPLLLFLLLLSGSAAKETSSDKFSSFSIRAWQAVWSSMTGKFQH